MNIRRITTALGLLGLLATTPGCKDFYNVNVDPLNPTSARLKDLLPVTQGTMAQNLGMSTLGMSQPISTLVNQLANTRDIGSYSLDGQSFNNQWYGLYADCLSNNEQIITQGTTAQSWTYVGIAQIQKAFVFSQMVDMWGNIPYSEALKGAAITAPKFDKDADIYRDLFALIDEGIANLDKQAEAITPASTDQIYNGDKAKWQRLGRTLKLKLYNQIRRNPAPAGVSTADLSTKVQALLGQDLMTSLSDDFEFRYANSTTPENRNPGYIVDYVTPSRENYVGRYLYELMKGQNDPRISYYFYNQVSSPTPLAAANFQDGRFITSLVGSQTNTGGNTSDIRTLPGLYPVGGKFDDGKGGAASVASGKGVVAQRLLPYFSRKFTEAEAQLTILNNAGAARTALQAAVQGAFDKVNNIASNDGAPAIDATAVTKYIDAALARYDAAAAPEGKLKVIMEEKYVAGFGFGEDVYTDYRRTGYPTITLPGSPEEPNTKLSGGGYPRVLTYRQTDLNTNINAPAQHNPAVDRLFWDVR